jgi:hypothetical protein
MMLVRYVPSRKGMLVQLRLTRPRQQFWQDIWFAISASWNPTLVEVVLNAGGELLAVLRCDVQYLKKSVAVRCWKVRLAEECATVSLV